MKKKLFIFMLILSMLCTVTQKTYALTPPAMEVETSKNVITSDNAKLFAKLTNRNSELISRFELKLYRHNNENEREIIYIGVKTVNSYDSYINVCFDICEDFKTRLLPNTKYSYYITAIAGDGYSKGGYSNGFNFTTLPDDRTIENDYIIETVDEWDYCVKDGYAHIVKYNGSDVEVVVPSVINNVPVKSIGDYAFAENDKMKSLEISEGITQIGDFAFYDSQLEELNIPASLTEIKYREDIGYSCFQMCHGLKNINVDYNNSVFSSIDGILCSKDKHKLLFYPSNRNATDFAIPYSVKEIAPHAFIWQRNLCNLTITPQVEKIDESNFVLFSYMRNIFVDSYSEHFSCKDGVLYNKDKTEIISVPGKKYISEFDIPSTVKVIGDYAFYNCRDFTKITIPDGVEKIGEYSFYGCQNITSLDIPATVTSIGENAFKYCSKLEKVNFLSENTISTKVNKAVINSVKRKSAKKIKISLKKVKGANGYQVAVYKSKTNAKKNKKALVKKFVNKRTVSINSNKFKNKKKLYIKARAYALKDDGKKNYGKWSLIKSVRMK